MSPNVSYHVSRNSAGDAANTSTGDDSSDDDLSNGVGRSLQNGANTDEKTAEKDCTLPTDLHAKRTDTE